MTKKLLREMGFLCGFVLLAQWLFDAVQGQPFDFRQGLIMAFGGCVGLIVAARWRLKKER